MAHDRKKDAGSARPDSDDEETAAAPGEQGQDASGPDAPPREAEERLPAEPVFTETELNDRLEAAAAETRERHLRVVAEYDNYRKRVQRERDMWAAEAIERFVADLVLVLDNFERALSTKADDAAAVVEGVRITERQLRAVLAAHGVECVDPVNAKFDPRFHEAVSRVPSGEREPGTVVAVLEKGYTLKGRLIRPARVQVAGDA